MNIAFLTESPFEGKISENNPNARTEIAWQIALDSYHYNIKDYFKVKGYDGVFVIIPKGETFLNSIGCKLIEKPNPTSELLRSNFTEVLKNNNKKIYFIQEGSVDRQFNDYEIEDQFNYYNHLQNFDILFAHNEYDTLYYKGMFPYKRVEVIPTLMLDHLLKDTKWNPENKVMLGGNFSNFYRGFQSYIVADEIKDHEKSVMFSHSTREHENKIPDLKVLPRMLWIDWMKELSRYKFGIHLMDLRAAGTFALNCAYYGIIVIGNKLMDTYRLIYPEWSVDVYDLKKAKELANILNEKSNDKKFLNDMSVYIKDNYKKHFSKNIWINKMNKILHE